MSQKPSIIYEDSFFLVIEKPAGMHSVQQEGSSAASLAQWLCTHFPNQISVGKTPGESGLVQRLDCETSGLILAAKENDSWESLRQLLMDGKITKHYQCLIEGVLSKPSVTVGGYIGSPYRRASKVRVYQNMPGKPHRVLPASTTFKQIKLNSSKTFSLVEATAATARRHQIRAHAASIGNPLIGDDLYGSQNLIQGDYEGTFFLQASHLSFTHPHSKKVLSFNLEVPDSICSLFL